MYAQKRELILNLFSLLSDISKIFIFINLDVSKNFFLPTMLFF